MNDQPPMKQEDHSEHNMPSSIVRTIQVGDYAMPQIGKPSQYDKPIKENRK